MVWCLIAFRRNRRYDNQATVLFYPFLQMSILRLELATHSVQTGFSVVMPTRFLCLLAITCLVNVNSDNRADRVCGDR